VCATCSDLPGRHSDSVLFRAVVVAVLKNEGWVFRSALIPNNPFNLDRVFVKEGNQPRMFSARNDESSRPVNACRFVLVFLCGESQG